MEETGVKRKLAVILAADVAGYSRLMGADEEATLKALRAYREIIDGLIAGHDGRIFATAGDSVVAEFASPVEAVRAAISIQEELAVLNAGLADERKMRLRIGINLGDVMVEGDNLLGDGVNVAARLEGLAVPGGICVSDMVYQSVEAKLDLAFEDLGAQSVKNIARPVRAYRVVVEPSSRAVTAPRPQPRRSPVTDKPSIAVLPFVNMSDDPKQEYFSDGITEDLITDLSKISGLFVVARNAVFLYKGKAVKPVEVSQELGVRYVLEGSVRKAGDRVRISAQLIDPPTGYHLWAERYDRELTDIFALQDEITEKIVKALEVKLTEGEQEQVARRYYAEAVRWYRKAAVKGFAEAQANLGFMYHKGRGVPQDDAEALKWYRKAANQGFARAQYNLGQMFRRGQGVPQDYAVAAKWYRKAAEQGVAEAKEALRKLGTKGNCTPSAAI